MAIVDFITTGLGLVRSEKDITPVWIQGLLRASGDLEEGVTVTGVSTERIGEGVGILSVLQRITPQYSGPTGAPESLVVKYPTEDPTQRFTADALALYVREIEFYKQVAPVSPMRNARCFGASMDTDSTDFTVVMEDIGSYRALNQLEGVSLAEAKTILTAIADFHAHWWDDPRLVDLEAWFAPISNPVFHAALPAMWDGGWPFVLQHAGDRLNDLHREIGAQWSSRIGWMLEEVMTPKTLLHGDFRADNIFFDRNTPVLLDFQICGTGTSVYDVAYFVSQSLDTDVRRGHDRELFDHYVDRLVEKGVTIDREEAWRQYKIAVVMCVTYGVTTFPGFEAQNERGQDLLRGMLMRALHAVEDIDAWSSVKA